MRSISLRAPYGGCVQPARQRGTLRKKMPEDGDFLFQRVVDDRQHGQPAGGAAGNATSVCTRPRSKPLGDVATTAPGASAVPSAKGSCCAPFAADPVRSRRWRGG